MCMISWNPCCGVHSEHITWNGHNVWRLGSLSKYFVCFLFCGIMPYDHFSLRNRIILSKQRRPGMSQGSIIWVIDTFVTIDTVSFPCELTLSPLAFIYVYYQVVELSNQIFHWTIECCGIQICLSCQHTFDRNICFSVCCSL
jgi:hypothetical protein